MSSEHEPTAGAPASFARSILPWIVLAGALALYLATLNRWVTLTSLGAGALTNTSAHELLSARWVGTTSLDHAARLAGWDWQPVLAHPLTFVVTYPLRWLPVPWQPLALNLLFAVCAALTLALLARSVALLPQDRTKDQRLREGGDFALLSIRGAWAPPLLAVLVCALQFDFWKHAVTGTGEMLNVLLLAYLIRCLLEYRITERDSWLVRMSFVYGLATTNNFAMMGFFPIALAAVIWLKGREFLNARFFLSMLGAGLAGLALYLLLPLLALRHHHEPLTFWTALTYYWHIQRELLLLHPARLPFLILGSVSLLPLLVVAIRWPSSMGDVNPISNFLSNLMFKAVHLGFFVAGIALLYGPSFLTVQIEKSLLPFLSLYYLGALCIGYFAGYLLLVFGVPATRAWAKPNLLEAGFGKLVVLGTYACLLLVPALFLQKNLPKIKDGNRPLLHDYAAALAQSLPKDGAVVISDQVPFLWLLQAWHAERGVALPHLPLSSSALQSHFYHRHLAAAYPNLWKPLPTGRDGKPLPEPLSPFVLLQRLEEISRSKPVYYLHPSFGYYFEIFQPYPRGLALELRRQPITDFAPTRPTAQELQQNLAFWQQLRPHLDTVATLARRQHPDALMLGLQLSRSLDYWGVVLQQNGRLPEAAEAFQQALRLNPDNGVALVNLVFNQRLRGAPVQTNQLFRAEQTLKEFRTPESILTANGPFDEPAYDFYLGQLMARNSLFRQAGQLFLRAREFLTNSIETEILLGKVYLHSGKTDDLMALINAARRGANPQWQNVTNQMELVRLEALAHFARSNYPAGQRVLEAAVAQWPASPLPLAAATSVYLSANQPSNALAAIERQLRMNPNDLSALLNQSVVLMQLKQYRQATVPLTRLLEKQPENHPARMNRAVAYLQAGQLEEARKDYERLRQLFPNMFAVYYGLGEIAYRKGDKRAAADYYQSYLKFAPQGTQERQTIEDRLKQLKGS